jgi:hypothetical protein
MIQISIKSLNNQSEPNFMFGFLFGINNNKVLFVDKFFKISCPIMLWKAWHTHKLQIFLLYLLLLMQI